MCKSSREDVNNSPGKTELSTKMCRELDSTHRVGVFWIGEGRRAGEGEGPRVDELEGEMPQSHKEPSMSEGTESLRDRETSSEFQARSPPR